MGRRLAPLGGRPGSSGGPGGLAASPGGRLEVEGRAAGGVRVVVHLPAGYTYPRMPYDPKRHAERRAAAAAGMRRHGGGVMLLPAADEKMRNADNEYLFRQDSDYFWLTGFEEPQGCALLFADPPPGKPGFVMFVRPRDPEREAWTGKRAGVDGAKAAYGADEAHPLAEMEAKLLEYLDHPGPLWFRLGHDREWDERVARLLVRLREKERSGVRTPAILMDPGLVVHELRLVKSAHEIDRLRRAAEITAEAHLAAMRDGRPGAREYQVQSEIEYAFRRRGGSGPGYGTIVAAGANACVLHYRAGDAVLHEGDLCLVDAGGEFRFYTADVTRTFPVSGTFSAAQREVYDVVLAAQLEGLAAVRPGATVDGLHDLVARRLAEGMVKLGLLEGNAEERVADGSYKRYYMHRTSHWLGMDVHDVGAYYQDGKSRALEPGMVFTVEPGLYVAPDDEKAPERLRGIGVRIEDDVLVTASGGENLTAAIPKAPADVEACCTR